MPFQYKSLELREFNGGMTDDYVNDAENRGQFIENFFVLNNKNLRTRFGTLLDDSTPGDEQIPSAAPTAGQRINALINYNSDDKILAHSAQNVFHRNPVSWAAIVGPATIAPLTPKAAEVPFLNADQQTHIAHTQWDRHLICTPDNFDKPVKIFKDDSGSMRCLTAGLPALASSPSIVSSVLPSKVFTQLLTTKALLPSIPSTLSPKTFSVDAATDIVSCAGHGFSTGQKVQLTVNLGGLPSPLATATTYYVIKIDNNSFYLASSYINAQSDIHIDLLTAGSGIKTVTPFETVFVSVAHGFSTGNKVRVSSTSTVPTPLGDTVDYYVIVLDVDHFMLAESLEEANSSTFITCEPDGVGTLTAVPQTGTGAFVYAFIYKNTYTVYNETFADLGPTTLVQILDTDAPDVLSKTISGIPVLLNGSGDNYDVNNIKVQIYRTVDGGQEFYLIGEVANGVTGFVDNFSDETIQNNEVLYTSGGVPDNDPPPLAKYCHTVNGKTYYAHIKEGSEIFPTLIRQSQNLDCDSVPFNYEDTVEDEINGISSVQDIPIVGCKRHVYRIDGSFDEVGRGGMSHRRISDHAGCVSHDSFVQAEGGLFWFGIDGIYHTEGYKAMKVTDNLNSTYKNAMETLVDKTRKVKGVYNATTRSIYWTFSRTSKTTGFEECDAIWVLDLMWGISEEMTCSVWYGFSTFSPSALMVYNNQLYRADARGYVLKFQENVGTDPQIKTGLPASTWFQETIKYKFTWISHNFGSSNQRKFANRIGLDILSKTNFSIQTKLTNDEGRVVRYTKGIRYRKNFQWGDEDFVWGNPAFSWFYGGITTSDRRMPAKGLRFNYLQFELSNDYTVIRNSDVWGNALIDNATKTATIIVSPNTWPIHAVDYYLYLEQDNFLNAYKIVDRTDTVIILENPTGTFIDGSQRWEIKGYKKAEVVQLAGVSISYADISRSYDTFNQGDDGEIS